MPGFIDLHMHGGGGHATLSADPTEIASAAAFHRAHGTTGSLASIVSAPLSEMLAALEAVRDAVPSVIGSHLEGPFLNPARAGAHDPAHLLPPDPATFERMLDAAGGTLRVITVAPELPGGIELVRQAAAAGVVVAVGHSDASHDEASAAFDAGASLVTHLFNAMRPWHHREPGLVGAALTRADVVCELINDGIHLHDATAKVAFEAAGRGRIALVTDAIAAAGTGDGEHRLGSAGVHVQRRRRPPRRRSDAGRQHPHHGRGVPEGGSRARRADRGCRPCIVDDPGSRPRHRGPGRIPRGRPRRRSPCPDRGPGRGRGDGRWTVDNVG